MPRFSFFMKDDLVLAQDRSAANFSEVEKYLEGEGFHKQFEEVDAPSAKSALVRFLDIRDDDEKTEYAFATGSIFNLLTDALLCIIKK